MDYKKWLKQWNEYMDSVEQPLIPIYETHWHPNLRQYEDCLDELMSSLKEAGIYRSIVPSIDAGMNTIMLEKLNQYDDISFAFAAHPKYAWKNSTWSESAWDVFEKLLENPKCIAVGETGLDYSYDSFCEEHQKLQTQFCTDFIQLANTHKLPLILHLRSGVNNDNENIQWNAYKDFMKIAEKYPIKYGATVHCFDGTKTDIEEFTSLNISYFGIGGKIMNATDTFVEAVKFMPKESILLETDAPYINTHPIIRGPNTPLLLYDVADRIAKIRHTTRNSIIEIANENAERLFRK